MRLRRFSPSHYCSRQHHAEERHEFEISFGCLLCRRCVGGGRHCRRADDLRQHHAQQRRRKLHGYPHLHHRLDRARAPHQERRRTGRRSSSQPVRAHLLEGRLVLGRRSHQHRRQDRGGHDHALHPARFRLDQDLQLQHRRRRTGGRHRALRRRRHALSGHQRAAGRHQGFTGPVNNEVFIVPLDVDADLDQRRGRLSRLRPGRRGHGHAVDRIPPPTSSARPTRERAR